MAYEPVIEGQGVAQVVGGEYRTWWKETRKFRRAEGSFDAAGWCGVWLKVMGEAGGSRDVEARTSEGSSELSP